MNRGRNTRGVKSLFKAMVVVEEVEENDNQEDDEIKEAEEEDEEQLEEKRRRSAEKTHDYLQFRREMDRFKREHKGREANSDKIKEQGNQLFSLGLYMQAATLYSEALELRPDSAVLYCNRAMAYLKQEMPDLALEDSEKSLEIDATVTNIKAYWRKSQALLDLERFEESEAAADAGIALQASNQHLNRVRRKAREGLAMLRLGACEWTCKLENGIEKRYTFNADGTMTMVVFGHELTATFELSCEGNPRSMVVRMKPMGNVAGTGPPPPPMPYIYEFHDGGEELWLCHPVNSTELPSKFEGPGFDRMRRAPKEIPALEDSEVMPLDERCLQYISEMNDAMPLIPPQLPERPSDEDISQETLLLEALSQLKRRYGLRVHQRSVELAKDPSLAECPELRALAEGLQKRFITRRILPPPKEEESIQETGPTPTAPVPTTAEPNPNGVKPPLSSAAGATSCLGGVVACLCGGQK